MAQRKLAANSTILTIQNYTEGEDLFVIICLTSINRQLIRDDVDATTACGPWKEPGQFSGNISFEGQQILELGANEHSFVNLYDLIVNGNPLFWTISPAIPVSNDFQTFGFGFLTELSDQYTLNTNGKFSGTISLQGSPNGGVL